MNQLEDEDQIISRWESKNTTPIVSICCTTFNHENYIEDALNGFLIQETNFSYEILVHDDASTDKTKQILEKYAKKYPRIIKLICQTENQYSKGKKINAIYNFPRANGKYIALCEGDDFWINKNKLKIQVTELENNENINVCFHSAIEQRDNVRLDIIARRSVESKVISPDEFITGGGEFCPTASIIFRKNIINALPDWFLNDAPVGDYFLQVISAMPNGGLYIDMPMSIYRTNVPGSWSLNNKNNPKFFIFIEKMTKCLNELDILLNNKYHDEISSYKSRLLLQILQNENINLSDRINFYHENKNSITSYERIKWKIIYSSPLRYKIHRLLRSYFK